MSTVRAAGASSMSSGMKPFSRASAVNGMRHLSYTVKVGRPDVLVAHREDVDTGIAYAGKPMSYSSDRFGSPTLYKRSSRVA
jgi:hypothetical protein